MTNTRSLQVKNLTKRIPLFSIAVTGWKLATNAFASNERKYRVKQQWKIFFSALINPQFACSWFEILKLPDLMPIVDRRQELYFKPFRVYMSTRWTKQKRIKVIQDTYRFILTRGGLFTTKIINKTDVELIRFMLNETAEGVLVLGYDYRYRKEGELILSFNCREFGGMIATAAFSFEEVNEVHWVCRIGCLQGHRKNVENSSKTVQKLLHGLRPKSLVIFVLQELSKQLGCSAVYGAGDAIHAYRRKHAIHLPWRHAIKFDYNSIWNESGGRLHIDGWYQIPLTAVPRSLHEIKSNKRSLYNRRYRLLNELSEKIANVVKNNQVQ